jgi:hypothetical protein
MQYAVGINVSRNITEIIQLIGHLNYEKSHKICDA